MLYASYKFWTLRLYYCMNKKGSIVLAILVLLALLSVASYAVSINLSSTDVSAIGGTGIVDVSCPAGPCQITKVGWTLTTSAPYQVDRVNVQWTTAKSSGATYTVYVVIYDNGGAVISYGSASQGASPNQVTTVVDVSNVSPRDVYKVEIVIVEQ